MRNIVNVAAYQSALMRAKGLNQRDAFDDWLHSVDCIMVRLYGLDSGSFEDWDWWGAFREGESITGAVAAWRSDLLREHGIGSHD